MIDGRFDVSALRLLKWPCEAMIIGVSMGMMRHALRGVSDGRCFVKPVVSI